MRLEIEVDESLIPAGFRATGFGKPRAGQWYEHCGAAHQAFNDFRTDKHLLLEKIEPVRESMWVNVYGQTLSSMYSTRESVNRVADTRVLKGVIRLDYEDNKLVAVTLEPQ